MPGISPILAPIAITLSLLLGSCAQPDARASHNGPARVADANDDARISGESQPFEEQAREVFRDKALPQADLPERAMDSALLYKFLLAEIAAQRGDYQLAAQAYLEMAKSTGDSRIARRATEIALYGQYNDVALQAARLWLAAEQDSAAARQTLAALLVNNNELQAAKPLLQQLLAADSENIGVALTQLYSMLAKHADKNAVLDLVKELTKPYRDRPEAHLALAQASLGANKYDAALMAMREAMRLRPDWEAGALFQAQILNRESRIKALDYLNAFLASHPKAQEVRLGYARQLINDKKFV
ncbi:MAG: hypothetical protein ABI619_10915, partial [Betaproteobacteria bacterium]